MLKCRSCKNVNLIRQPVSLKKYVYKQVSDFLKIEYPNSRGFPERTVRRYCKENETSSRADTNEVNRTVADAAIQVDSLYGHPDFDLKQKCEQYGLYFRFL